MESFRDVELLPAKTVGNSGTETIDVNVTEPITEMLVYFRQKNYTSGAANYPPHRQISKIEIVDGGQVYYSLSGHLALAASCHDVGKFPSGWWDDKASATPYIRFALRFGRFLGDEEFAFSPTRLLNPQIKITWAYNATYHATGENQLGVVTRLMEGVGPPSRMLAWKEIRSFTTGSSGDELTDLPRDYPYRQMLVRAYKLGSTAGHWYWVNNYKLDCDGGKYIPFNLSIGVLANLMRSQVPEFQYFGKRNISNGDLVQTWMGSDPFTIGASGSQCYSWGFHNNGSPYVQVWGRDDAGGAVADADMFYNVRGFMPSSALLFRFGRLNDPATWFNAPKYGDIKLWQTQDNADATATIVLQQPRPLP